jgi:branched-chain amino acid transport system substrate-binding protein
MKLKTLALAALAATLMAGSAVAQDIKIGVLNDRSGVYADLSGEGSVIAARMAVEDFGAADKGINVEIISADHQNKPDVASNIARQWYDEEGVDVIVDVPTSSAALAVNEVTREKDKIFINSGAGSADLTGSQCSPNTIHWTYDTWALAHGTGKAMVDAGYKNWFFLTADYAFGHALERDTAAVVEANGGTVVGTVRHPFPGTDFSSFLLQAQASGADVIGLANAGGDTVNAIKQASEFGITQSGQALAGLLIFITDVHALGLETAQGLTLTESFYWDLNEETREWSARFAELNDGKMPTMVQAGVYAGVLHYLKAVEATGGKETAALMEAMKSTPTSDPLFGEGEVRADGRKIHDMYLFQVKTPEESEGPWDYYKLVSTIPSEIAFRPLEDGGCELVQ